MKGEREARLDRDEFTRLLRLVDAAEELEHGYEPEEYDTYVERLLAHDAALRAEIDRLHGIARDAYVEGYYDGVEAERERNIQPRSTVKILADAHLKAKLEGEDEQD